MQTTRGDNKSLIRRIASFIKRKFKRNVSIFVSTVKLRRIDSRPIPNLPNEIRLFVMVRNEALRLPYLFKYYFSKGIDRVFLIDNCSTDSSVSIALSQNNTHVFQTKETFENYNNWMEILLNKYGKRYWCVAIDADEILHYPHAEVFSLKEFCWFLDKQGHTSLQCLLLDMYSDKPMNLTSYKQGQNPLSVCPYFDVEYDIRETRWINQHALNFFKFDKFTGNMRRRVFGIDANLSKFPLFKYGPNVYAGPGRHAVDGTVISDVRGVLLHFKYLQDFNSRIVNEAIRGQHAGNAASYKTYAKKVQDTPSLTAYYEKSEQFIDSNQLVRLGLMKHSKALEDLKKIKNVRKP